MYSLKAVTIVACCAAMLLVASCKKNAVEPTPVIPPVIPPVPVVTVPTDTSGKLKALTAASFTHMGMAVTYTPMSTIPAYLATVKREAGMVTFGNELKEGSVVRSDGSYDYSTADALYNLCATNGLQVFGHTLLWHSQQNATYLNGLISAAGTAGTPGPDLLATANGDFETGSGTSFTGWTNLSGGTSAATFNEAAGNGSARGLNADVATAGANAYDVQTLGPTVNITSGHTYRISLDAKAAAAGGKIRIVVQNASYLQYEITPTTSWATYTFSLVINEAQPSIRLNFPLAGNYTVDNIKVSDISVGAMAPTAAQAAVVVDKEMKKYITTTMTHYTGKINAWDVANEVLLENGKLRNNNTYTIPTANLSNEFLYGQYLGSKYDADNYILKAFKYAKEANPNALRFINDYNLETSKLKVDSMKALVSFLNKNETLVNGIGTQMHISINTPKTSIDYGFQTLASTGLLVKISELDVIINTSRAGSFTPNQTQLNSQKDMYKYVIQSYLKYVPGAQRYGITVWGVSDTDSWLNTPATPDSPLLFDKSYLKKPAYIGFKEGLL